jgi:hypothetical protein
VPLWKEELNPWAKQEKGLSVLSEGREDETHLPRKHPNKLQADPV